MSKTIAIRVTVDSDAEALSAELDDIGYHAFVDLSQEVAQLCHGSDRGRPLEATWEVCYTDTSNDVEINSEALAEERTS